MEKKDVQIGDDLWITIGFICAILGGLLGIVIGGHYIRGNYDKKTKDKGWIMAIIGFVMMIIWKGILK